MAELDIGLPDISKAINQAKEYLEVTKQITAAKVEEAKALKALVAINPMKGAKDYQDMAKALRESTQVVKEYNDIQGKARKIQKEITVATAAETKAKLEKQEQTRKLNQLLKEEIALEDKQIGTLKRLSIESNKLRRERDGLNLETAEGVKRAKEINAQLDINNKKLVQFSDANKRAKLNVGNYTDSINEARIGMLNLASAFGVATGIFAFTSALRGAFNIISENEDAFASLSAITGLTGEKFEVFKTAINDTAEELKVSSTEVAEAAEKIASAQPALLDNADALAEVTKQAIILNKAIKGDLTETSQALVGVMNQFGLEAAAANDVINILAAGSQAGAASVNQINESIVKFGTTADLMNISVEESVGLIETLGEKAIFGADAGTALRNILLKMSSIDVLPDKAQKQLEKYGVNTDIVRDKSLSFEERLRELSKVAKDSTAIMQIFGTENATAATVLLNNLDTYDKMTAAVTGTNVAQEQAAINSDTLSNVVKELGAAWDNLVAKWANGTDVAGGLKDILRFVTDNLEEIIYWVIKGITVWGSYRIALLAVNKEGTGFLQILRNMVMPAKNAAGAIGQMAENSKKVRIGFAGWVAIIVALLPLLIDMGKAIYQAFDRTTSLEKATERLNDEMGKEKDKMQLLFEQIKLTNAGSDDRLKLIKQINATYGTSLQNLEDEALFMHQLEAAYKGVIAQMERKLYQQILEEEFLDALKRKREAEKLIAEGGSAWSLLGLGSAAMDFNAAVEDIQMLKAEMAKFGFEMSGKGGGFGFAGKHKGTPMEEMLGLDSDGKEKLKKDIKDVENIIESMGDGEKFDSILDAYDSFDDEVEFDPEDLTDRQPIDEILPEDIISKATAEEVKDAYDSITDSVNRLSDALEEMIQLRVDEIDTAISHRQDEIQMRNDRISDMKQLAAEGVLTAEQSIKAEEARVSGLQADIQALERKKQKLLVINLALQTATNLAEGGDGSAIVKAEEQVGKLIKNLQSFKVGTDKTGKGNIDKDGGFLAINHPDEMIWEKELSDPFRKMGMGRHDIADAAMMAMNNDMMNGRAMMSGSFADVMTLATLNKISDGQDEIVKAIKNIDIPEYSQNWDAHQKAFVEVVKNNHEIKRYFTFLKK